MDAHEAHLAQGHGDQGAHDDAGEHGHVGQEALHELGDEQDEDQHQGGNSEVDRGAIGWVGDGARRAGDGRVAARGPVHADAHEGHADDGDDGARHHRREERQHAADQRGDQDAEDTRADDRAVDAQQPQLGVASHDYHGTHGGEGDAHHHRQLDAKAPEAERLDQGDDAAGEEVGVDELRHLLLGELESAADDERHRYGAGIHHQHMLDAQQGQAACGEDFVNGMHVRRVVHGGLLQGEV